MAFQLLRRRPAAGGWRLAETLITGQERVFFKQFIKEHASNKDVFTPELLDLDAKSYTTPHTLNVLTS